MTPQETAALLREKDRFLILTHVRPDGDTVGCAAALCEALQNLGKTAYVLPNPELTSICADYVMPFHAPADYAPDYVVSTDVASLGLLPDNAKKYAGAIDFAIDHHPSYEGFAKEGACVESDKAAAGEVVYEIVRALGGVTPRMATALYCAVSTDTGCFVYNNTTANAHRIAAALIEAGCDVQGVNKRHFRTKSQSRIALESAIMSSVEYHDGGRVAVVTVPQALLRSVHATADDAEEISSMAGVIEGVDCALTVRELENGQSKISLRTGDRVNATAACKLLGGGGHAQAAGATLDCPLDEAREQALAAIAAVAKN